VANIEVVGRHLKGCHLAFWQSETLETKFWDEVVFLEQRVHQVLASDEWWHWMEFQADSFFFGIPLIKMIYWRF
jgi:hypothetical protein